MGHWLLAEVYFVYSPVAMDYQNFVSVRPWQIRTSRRFIFDTKWDNIEKKKTSHVEIQLF